MTTSASTSSDTGTTTSTSSGASSSSTAAKTGESHDVFSFLSSWPTAARIGLFAGCGAVAFILVVLITWLICRLTRRKSPRDTQAQLLVPTAYGKKGSRRDGDDASFYAGSAEDDLNHDMGGAYGKASDVDPYFKPDPRLNDMQRKSMYYGENAHGDYSNRDSTYGDIIAAADTHTHVLGYQSTGQPQQQQQRGGAPRRQEQAPAQDYYRVQRTPSPVQPRQPATRYPQPAYTSGADPYAKYPTQVGYGDAYGHAR